MVAVLILDGVKVCVVNLLSRGWWFESRRWQKWIDKDHDLEISTKTEEHSSSTYWLASVVKQVHVLSASSHRYWQCTCLTTDASQYVLSWGVFLCFLWASEGRKTKLITSQLKCPATLYFFSLPANTVSYLWREVNFHNKYTIC